MDSGAVSVHFDSGHLFLDLSDGESVEFPLGWFPVLQAATETERGHFAISLDRQQLYWPDLDEEMSISALLQSLPDRTRH
ncbi:ethanolamine utilization protein [Paraburkholderia ginsengiterrae]|uniref:Ethanolamine utilization protein n=2 Tax=Paraburkholderia ginsengiterrae TaxID=1462993 RepID=A0A1A9NI42_9BURK|nr:ethanolamine utilization protein [Paraburkholderia ginsengiterrae]OAJ65758.1 ethanolamine utilization protein [Paraburkholderia ginsengiterrae]